MFFPLQGVLYDAAAVTNPNPVPYGIPVEVPPIDVTGGERLEMTNNVYHSREGDWTLSCDHGLVHVC